MNILVAGGAGFIGSHTCVALILAGHSVVVADNFCNSSAAALDGVAEITGTRPKLYEIDVTDEAAVEHVFSKEQLDGVIHFAGHKAVAESVDLPLKYYQNNVLSTIVLAKACLAHGVHRFVFSSSATVYGANTSPLKETMALMPTENPYGETKVMSEKILTDTAKANPEFSVSLLRYFNPVGAHESGLIGESSRIIPTNLMPRVILAAKGKIEKIMVFGEDYPTPDGTAVRDYIHVMDLAEGHVAAVAHLKAGVAVYNLGTGKGTSVLELINTFSETNAVKVPFELTDRRAGDLGECYANTEKAKAELGFSAKRDVIKMCRDAWNFEEKQSQNLK